MGPWPPTLLFAVANWRDCDTAPPLRCAEVRLCFLSPCVGFLKGLVERPTLTCSQSWPALPPKLDMVACACAALCGAALCSCACVMCAAVYVPQVRAPRGAVCSVWLLVSVISCSACVSTQRFEILQLCTVSSKKLKRAARRCERDGVKAGSTTVRRPPCADRQAEQEPTKTPPEVCFTCCCTLERLSRLNSEAQARRSSLGQALWRA